MRKLFQKISDKKNSFKNLQNLIRLGLLELFMLYVKSWIFLNS
jgi:hypothetical protein